MLSRYLFATLVMLSIIFYSSGSFASHFNKLLSNNSFSSDKIYTISGINIIAVQAGFNMSYIIEIGLWRKKEAAIEEFQTLQANHPVLKKYKPIIEMMDYSTWNRGIAFRLRIGYMRNKALAEKICETMRQDGYQKKCQVEFMPN